MCFYCKCKTMVPSVTTHVVTLGNSVIIVKNMPCDECEQRRDYNVESEEDRWSYGW